MPDSGSGVTLQDMQTATSTAGTAITPLPTIEATQTAASILTEDIGFDRSRTQTLNQEYGDLHQRIHFVEWQTRTAARGHAGAAEMLGDLADLGFAWRDIARLVGVSVTAVQKWRRGGSISGTKRRSVASILAACDLITGHYGVEEIASWFEMPIVDGAPITAIDLYAGGRPDLVFEYASGHVDDPEQIVTDFEPGWRERYRSDFEVFRADDGDLSIRPKAP